MMGKQGNQKNEHHGREWLSFPDMSRIYDLKGGQGYDDDDPLTGMVVLSILCGLATGQSAQVAAAAVEGTQAAVELCLSIAGCCACGPG